MSNWALATSAAAITIATGGVAGELLGFGTLESTLAGLGLGATSAATSAATSGTAATTAAAVANAVENECPAAEGVTAEGLATIEAHLARLGALEDPPNAAMLGRLKAGETTSHDLNFYAHELYESQLMRGSDYGYDAARAAHLQTLESQGIPYAPGYESQLYHPDVITEFLEFFNPAVRPK